MKHDGRAFVFLAGVVHVAEDCQNADTAIRMVTDLPSIDRLSDLREWGEMSLTSPAQGFGTFVGEDGGIRRLKPGEGTWVTRGREGRTALSLRRGDNVDNPQYVRPPLLADHAGETPDRPPV